MAKTVLAGTDRRKSIAAGCILAFTLVAASRGAESPAANAPAEAPGEEIVVTGSRISTLNSVSPSPVAVIDNLELIHQGTSRAEELLNNLPQINSGLTLGANGAGVAPLTGTATVDLRGIGAFRTLVLLNGRRLNPGDPNNPSADLNTVPTALVKRVEVLTGGASSIYGSDAIAGVVNFVMDTNFTGIRLDVQGKINHAANDRGDLQDIARASGLNPATGSTWDGGTVNGSVVYGTDLAAGNGHISTYFQYNHTRAVLASSRDFSACTLVESGASFACQLDSSTPLGVFTPPSATPNPLTLNRATGNTFQPFDPSTQAFNPTPYQYLQRPDTRYNLGLFGEFKLGAGMKSYVEAQYSHDRTSVGYEPAGTTPTGAAPNVFNVNCNNPLLSAGQVNDLCTSNGLGPTALAAVGIGRRNVEAGPLTTDYSHESTRLVAGLKGPLADDWSYDVSALFGNTSAHVNLANDYSASKLQNALNVVSVGAVPTCQSVVDGTDPNCVPYNIFQVGGVNPAALNYVTQNASQDGTARHWVLNGTLTGELDKFGIKSPFAAEGVGVAAGAEYRSESINNSPSSAYTSGDLLVSGPLRPTHGTYSVVEAFGELRVPLVSDRPFIRQLNLDISDRYARYSPQGSVNAFKLGGEWAPVDLMRMRGSYSKAVRAPNGHELFLAQTLTQLAIADPCSGPTPAASPASCALTGVSAAQYGKIPAALSVNQLIGGNPGLRPETADTFTAGIVLTPLPLAPHLVASVDYWRIKVNKFLGSIPAAISFNSCLNTGDPTFCSLIHRDAGGSLSQGNGPAAGRIIATGLNTGSYGESGVDLDLRDTLDLAGGHLTLTLEGTRALTNPIEIIPGQTEFDCTGFIGPNCTGAGPTSPVPRWRHKMRAAWSSAMGFDASINWRHIGALDSEHTSSNPQLNGAVFPVDAHIGSFNYLDLDAGYAVTKAIEIRVGINNFTDRRPPIMGYSANPLLINGNLAAGMYDFLGRELFVGMTANF